MSQICKKLIAIVTDENSGLDSKSVKAFAKKRIELVHANRSIEGAKK